MALQRLSPQDKKDILLAVIKELGESFDERIRDRIKANYDFCVKLIEER